MQTIYSFAHIEYCILWLKASMTWYYKSQDETLRFTCRNGGS